MSFYTSLSGLKAAQTDLAVTANNVANVGSVGFKKSRAEFGDLISSSPLQSGNIAGQGTRLKGIEQQFTQGGFASSERALDLAISGQGFFVTRSEVSGGTVAFTRNGTFTVDSNRYVTDSRGSYLQVLPVDETGAVSATGLTSTRPLQLPLTTGEARATSNVDLSVSFPASADIPANRAVYQGSTPYVFDRFDANSYNYASATTVYDSSGTSQQATIYYSRTKAPTDADPTSEWEARLFVGNAEASADGQSGTVPVPLKITFDATGTITAPTGYTAFSQVSPSGSAAGIQLNINYGVTTKQASGPFSLVNFTQDGKASGQLDNVSVGNDGLVTATFSDGTTQALGKLLMANFANPGGLRQLGDASWGVTGESGEAIVGEANSGGFGIIQSGALEQANVDITEELVALISAQRNFQANAKAIETANTLTQTIVNLRN